MGYRLGIWRVALGVGPGREKERDTEEGHGSGCGTLKNGRGGDMKLVARSK